MSNISLKENINNYYNKFDQLKIIDPGTAKNNICKAIVFFLLENGIKVQDIDTILVHVLKISDRAKFKHYYIDKLKSSPRCTICGVKKDLELHHIKPKSKHPELEFDLDNVTLLCSCCHNLLHHGGGKKLNPDLKAKTMSIFKNELNKKLTVKE